VVFDAFVVPELADVLLAKFTSFKIADQVRLIADNPKREFVSIAIDIFSSAGSYRDAEQLGQSTVLPLASHYESADIGRLLAAVLGNSQISYASGTPDLLLEVFTITQALLSETRAAWQHFVDEMTAQHGGKVDAHYSYPEIRTKLDAA
jgi:hypothetical protein